MYVCVFLCGYVHTECRSLQRPGAAGPLAEGVTESYELPDVDARGLLEGQWLSLTTAQSHQPLSSMPIH